MNARSSNGPPSRLKLALNGREAKQGKDKVISPTFLKLMTTMLTHMMKYGLLTLLLLLCALVTQGQNKGSPEQVVITSLKKKTRVYTNKNGDLHVNVSRKDVVKYKAAGLVHYSDFGARGDGKAHDMDAIVATHAFANLHGLLVKADKGATYYVSGKERTALIRTDADVCYWN